MTAQTMSRHKRMSAMTPSELEDFRAIQAANARERIWRMTPEQGEKHLERRRQLWMFNSLGKDEQKRQARERSARWREANPHAHDELKTDHHYRKNFGISLDDYNAMLESQGGVCYICKAEPKRNRLCLDHDHDTGENRRLLCSHCNRIVGVLEATPDLVNDCLDYINEFSSKAVAA